MLSTPGVDQIWVKSRGFSLCGEPSLNLHYLTDIFLPCFLHCFLTLCFALFCGGILAFLTCKSTKQFSFFNSSWLFFTWLRSSPLSPHWTLFNSLLSFNGCFLSFSDKDRRREVLVAWQGKKKAN